MTAPELARALDPWRQSPAERALRLAEAELSVAAPTDPRVAAALEDVRHAIALVGAVVDGEPLDRTGDMILASPRTPPHLKGLDLPPGTPVAVAEEVRTLRAIARRAEADDRRRREAVHDLALSAILRGEAGRDLYRAAINATTGETLGELAGDVALAAAAVAEAVVEGNGE